MYPPPPRPPVAPAANPWESSLSQNPTDSFTFQIPIAQQPLPPAPATFPETAPAAPPAPGSGLAAEPDEDAGDERTVVVDRRPKAEWGLRLPSGELVLVDGVLLLGRKPVTSAGPVGARRVIVDDPERTVSRSHLVIEPIAGVGIVLRDVSSANGIILVAPDGTESEIDSGGEVQISDRCSIILGTFEIGIERV